MCGIKTREISENDTSNIVKWRNNPNVNRHFCMQDRLTEEAHTYWLNNVVKTNKAKQFIISEESTGMDIGTVYLRDIDYKNKKAEMGVYIGEDCCRGKGYGSEAIRFIINYGFATLNLHKIYLRVLANNSIGIKSYEKCGFMYEGTAKDDIILPDGKYQDIIFMAIINSNNGGKENG